jgi:predicted glycoside hydrolase/deacetylase ChbG (UPF0249 family)
MEAQDKSNQENAKTTWAEKLGYPAGKKVIILHADDAGMSEGANIATAHYLANNLIQSAAIMAPCPAADEFIQWAIDHPDKDVGMHLTHTSEWKSYRWGPVSDPAEVPGLIDPEGMLWHGVPGVVMHASADEVEKEIRAQIDKAIAMGHRPTHIDTHMGTLYGSPAYVERFFKVAEEYGIPANAIDLSDPQVADKFKQAGYPIDDHVIGLVEQYSLPKLDNFTSAPNGKSYEEKIENFKTLIRSLPAGLTEIIFHPSVESEELKSITNSWQQRVWEAKMFSDPALIKFFEEEEIVFTNWIEIMERFSDGWISLYNGKNLDGWRVRGTANWSVKDGIMVGQSNAGTGHIYAGPELTDLEVKGMFRLSDQGGGGNSGLYFRANPPEDNPDGYPVGYEAQICHNQEAHTGWLWKPGTPTGKANALLTKNDEWFSMRVRAQGSLIQIWVNNQLVMTYEDEEYQSGFFAIQCHNPGMTIESKELYYRDLTK